MVLRCVNLRLCLFSSMMAWMMVLVPSSFAQGEGEELKRAPESEWIFTAPLVNLAIIDTKTIITKSKAAQKTLEGADELRRSIRDEIAKKQDKLEDEKKNLERKSKISSDSSLQAKIRDWEERVRLFNKEGEFKGQQLDLALRAALFKINAKILEITQKIALQSNINLVLDRERVQFFSKEMDITDMVLERLDDQLPEMELDMNEAKKLIEESQNQG